MAYLETYSAYRQTLYVISLRDVDDYTLDVVFLGPIVSITL